MRRDADGREARAGDGTPRAADRLVGTRLELDVGAVAHGGSCVARHEGRVVFVRHALPGERVLAVVTEGRAGERYLRADAVEILAASPDRVTPPCPYAGPGKCGGCDWQHATLDAQRRLKAAVVEEQLLRLAGLERKVAVEAVPGDHEGLGWRTRIRFGVDEKGRLGLRKARSHEMVAIGRCRIAAPELDALGATDHRWPPAASVELASGASGDRLVVVRTADSASLDPAALPRLTGGPSVAVAQPSPAGRPARDGEGELRRLRGRTWLAEQAAGRSWRVTGGSFWQVHPGAADALVAAVLEGLEPRPGERAVDLYSGVGLFAGALADRLGPHGQVVAVESDRRALGDARRNLHDLATVRLVHERVEAALRTLLAEGGSVAGGSVAGGSVAEAGTVAGGSVADLVVLDPPRTGAGRDVVVGIVALAPRRIAYVACDPAALARDLADFARRGYHLCGLRAYDLFPMTHHVECVAMLGPAGHAPALSPSAVPALSPSPDPDPDRSPTSRSTDQGRP